MSLDSETWKTILTTCSALVSIYGAWVSTRNRKESRRDMFESLRDTLILTMKENDYRCSQIAIQVAATRAELAEVMPTLNGEPKKFADSYSRSLDELEKLSKTPQLREYKESGIDQLAYSEGAISVLRRMTRGELANSKALAPDTYELVFNEIAKFVREHRL